MGYTANYLDVMLLGGALVAAIVYLAVKGELGKW
jgi:hypothetical protein